MPLRRVAQVLTAPWRTLRSIQQGIDTIMAQLSKLTAAYAALALATTSALSTIATLQQQHVDDAAKLVELTKASDDEAISTLAADMQARAEKIQASLTDLHATVTSTADEAKASLGSDSVTGAGADTIASGTHDSVDGAATATVAGAGTDTVPAA